MRTKFNFKSYFQKREVTKSNKTILEIKCVGFMANGKIYKSRYHWLIALAKEKVKKTFSDLFKTAWVRSLLIEAKIAFLRTIDFTWEKSCEIASLRNEIKAMKKGHSLTCKEFIVLPYSKRKLL